MSRHLREYVMPLMTSQYCLTNEISENDVDFCVVRTNFVVERITCTLIIRFNWNFLGWFSMYLWLKTCTCLWIHTDRYHARTTCVPTETICLSLASMILSLSTWNFARLVICKVFSLSWSNWWKLWTTSWTITKWNYKCLHKKLCELQDFESRNVFSDSPDIC
jgi:hypothetical protein